METTINLNQNDAQQQQDTQQVNAKIDISQQGESTIATVQVIVLTHPLIQSKMYRHKMLILLIHNKLLITKCKLKVT